MLRESRQRRTSVGSLHCDQRREVSKELLRGETGSGSDKDGNDSIAVRSIQRFTLGFDHRIIDGADAGKFMTDFKNYLENWSEDIG